MNYGHGLCMVFAGFTKGVCIGERRGTGNDLYSWIRLLREENYLESILLRLSLS